MTRLNLVDLLERDNVPACIISKGEQQGSNMRTYLMEMERIFKDIFGLFFISALHDLETKFQVRTSE